MLSYVVNLWRRRRGGRRSAASFAAPAASLEGLEPREFLSAGKIHQAHAAKRHAKHPKPVQSPIQVSVGQTTGTPDSRSPIIGTGSIFAPGAGQTFSITLGSFNGVAGQSLADALQKATNPLTNYVTVAWGDGTNSQGVLQADDQGNLDVVATHKYVAAGTFNVGVVVTQGPAVTPGKPLALFSTRVIAVLFGGAVVH
jgi:hypothetical protein